jgi:hypothetical protein
VPITVSRKLIAYVAGVQRCGSPWSCPPCSSVVRHRRAEEINRAVEPHLAGGGGALLLTLTLPHGPGDALAPRLNLVSTALKACFKGSGWERRRDRLGYVGSIRSVEVTWGEDTGWHPHVHVLVLFDRQVGEARAEDFRAWVYGRWNGFCEDRGFGTVHPVHGVDVEVVSTSGDLSRYLGKAEGGAWEVGQEVARGDAKRGRAGRMAPFELLAEFVDTGEARLYALWMEYEAATFGKSAIHWSPGLRAKLLGDEPEESDEELAAAEGLSADVLVQVLEDAERRRADVRAGTAGRRLAEIENAAAMFWFMTLWRGGPSDGKERSDHTEESGHAAPVTAGGRGVRYRAGGRGRRAGARAAPPRLAAGVRTHPG